MKKIIVILAVVGIIGAGAATYFLLVPRKAVEIEDILPPEAQMFARVRNAGENMALLSSSPLVQTLSRLNYDELVVNDIVDAGQLAVVKEILAKINDPRIQTVLNEVFGKEFAIAVYPLSVPIGNLADFSVLTTPTFLDDALSNFMIVCRISSEMQVAELFSRLVANFGSETTKETLTYKDIPINSIVFNKLGVRISYAMIKDLLVVTLSERAVQKVIDVQEKERPSLAGDPAFVKAKERTVVDSDIYVYWDMARFFTYISDQMKAIAATPAMDEAQQAQVRDQVNSSLEAVKGFKSFVLSGRMTPLVELKLNLVMDAASLSPQLSYLYTCNPVPNKSINFIPAGVLGYQWSSCLGLENYWNQLKKEMTRQPHNPDSKTPSPMEELERFEAQIGLSVERDILPAIGDEFGGFLADIQMEGLFPIPKFLMFIEVKDRNKVDKLLSVVTKNPMLMLQEEDYSGTAIHYFSSPVGGEELQPGYAYLDDYLLIAINRKIMKSSIDAKKAGSNSLTNDPAFQAIDKGLTENNVNMYYLQMGVFAKKIDSLLQWGNRWSDSQLKQREGMKAGSEQRLAIVKQDMTRIQNDVESLEKEVEALEGQLTTSGTQQAGSAVQEELTQKNELLSANKNDLGTFQEEMQELNELIQTYENDVSDSHKRDLFLRDFVQPLMGALNSIEAVGGRSTISGDIYESTILMKVN